MFEGIKPENGRWSQSEHQLFLKGLEKYGKDWRKIEKIIATRSSSQIRSHAQKFFSKLRKSGKNNFLISPVSTINQPQSQLSSQKLTTKTYQLNIFLNQYDQLKQSDQSLKFQYPSQSLFSELNLSQINFWQSLSQVSFPKIYQK